jgi:hypothetical protein
MRRRILLVVCLIPLSLITWEVFNAVRWSSSRIVPELLSETPPGTDREVVVGTNRAKRRPRVGIPGVQPEGSLGFDVGGFRGVLGRTRIWAFYVFDEEGNLSDIYVQSWWMDAL